MRQQDMMHRFLPFLPPCGTSTLADGPHAAEALDAIQEDVEWLLSSDGPTFWSVVRTDSSLSALIDSFLRYSSRPYDDEFCNVTPAELALRSLVLAVLHRATCRQEPGAPAAPAQRGALLASLLDVPRLLDLCALHTAAPAQAALLRELLGALLRLRPALGAELAAAAGAVAENLTRVLDACLSAVGRAGSGDPKMLQSLLDGIDYLRDVCLTLCALLASCPPAAGLLLSTGPALLEALTALHDSLLPAAAKLAWPALGRGATPEAQQQRLQQRLLHLEVACERAVVLLLTCAYLGPTADGNTSAGATSGSSSGSSSSRAGQGSAASPMQRGEGLLSSVMLLGHSEGEWRGGADAGALPGALPLARALAERHGLGGLVESALLEGRVELDDAQAGYLAALLGVPSLAEAPAPVPRPGGSAAAAADGSAGAARQEEDAMLASQISQIRDLLPDYGEGYLAACLEAYDGQPERVIDALLGGGGGLYPALAELDPQLSLAQYRERCERGRGGTGGTDAADKGKRRVGEDFGGGSSSGGWGGAGAAAAAAVAAAASGSAGGGPSGSSRAARPESKTARYLDVREGSYRESLISTATALQWEDEYDDEPDDSLDELLVYGADGVTEIEEEAAAGPSRAGAGAAGAAAAGPGMAPLPRAAPAQQQPPQQQGGRGREKKAAGRLWVLDGRIYNYPKPGAQGVSSREDAEKQLEAARQAALEIHGLGPGGNVPLPPSGTQQWRQQQQQQQQQQEGAGGGAPGPGGGPQGRSRGGAGPPPGGRGQGSGGGGRGGPPGGGAGGSGGGGGRGRGDPRDQHRFKDQHKSAIANHHRKDRALKKAMGGSMG